MTSRGYTPQIQIKQKSCATYAISKRTPVATSSEHAHTHIHTTSAQICISVNLCCCDRVQYLEMWWLCEITYLSCIFGFVSIICLPYTSLCNSISFEWFRWRWATKHAHTDTLITHQPITIQKGQLHLSFNYLRKFCARHKTNGQTNQTNSSTSWNFHLYLYMYLPISNRFD